MTEKGPILTGSHFMLGDQACAEGAIYAGCRFFAGYPITPATEIAERMAERLPAIGGQYIQMEDEIGSVAAVLGASVAGVRAMTATSGPGFSLMQENLGLAFMMEVPCVVVNVQRGGPSTGLPTSVGQQDMMQAASARTETTRRSPTRRRPRRRRSSSRFRRSAPPSDCGRRSSS